MFLMKSLSFAILLFLLVAKTWSYNILGIFPVPIASHFYFAKPLLQALAENGHNVTVVSYFPDGFSNPNYTEISIPGTVNKEQLNLNMFENHVHSPWVEFHRVQDWGLADCENIFKSKIISNILQSNTKFDVMITEQFNNDCVLSLCHILDIPLVSLSSCSPMLWLNERFGSPLFTSYMPANNYGTGEEMAFWDRFKSLVYFHYSDIWYKQITRRQTNAIIRKYLGDSVPDIGQIAKEKSSVLLVNLHYSLTGIKPYAPNVIEVSGLQIPKQKPLEKEMKTILDRSTSGVVYINWGSMIRSDSLPAYKREAIQRAVTKLGHTVIWKWENETMPNQPENVFITKWTQQFDVLCHRNVKVFMSHGGLMGTSEAAYCGVPVVVTPIFGDQFLNAAALEERGLGLILSFDKITEDNVYDKLKEALKDKSQRKAAEVSEAYRNRPEDPLKTAIWWVNRIAETKGQLNIRSNKANLPWFILNSVDVYATFTVILLIALISLIYLIKFIVFRHKHSQNISFSHKKNF